MTTETQAHSINWFEIPATDLERSARFYEAMLGVTLMREASGPKPMAIFGATPGGVAGCVVKDADRKAGDAGTRIYLRAPDLDACVGRVAAAGGHVVLPRTSIGPHGFIALVRDPDGNTVGLHMEPAEG